MGLLSRFRLERLQKKVHKTHQRYEQSSTSVNLKQLIKAHQALAQFYDRLAARAFPNAGHYGLACYRVMAQLGDLESTYACGARLVEAAKFWTTLAKEPVYGLSVYQRYADGLYEEARLYLDNADKQEYFPARRLLGKMHIHGWGVPVDLNHGYTLILESIDLEKAWGRATKIFEELHLNSPDFFAALRSYRGKQ